MDLFDTVIEPEFSKSVLKRFEHKYGITTAAFLRLYRNGFPLPIPLSDAREWNHANKMIALAEQAKKEADHSATCVARQFETRR